MQGVNKKVVWAFAGALAGVMLMLVSGWQLLLLAVLAGVGYTAASLHVAARVRAFVRRRRS